MTHLSATIRAVGTPDGPTTDNIPTPQGATMSAVLPDPTTLGDARSQRAERLALLTERRMAERSRELIDLQQTRPDLVGAYAPADFAADALRWAV